MPIDLNTLTAPVRHEFDRGRIAGRLADVANARVDIVVPQSALTIDDNLETAGVTSPEAMIFADGVVPAGERLDLRLTRTALRHLAGRLRIPLPYVDRLTDDQFHALAAVNFNTIGARDARKAMLRLLADGQGGNLLTAVLSNTYQALDNLDLLTATARGLQEAGVNLGECVVEANWTIDRFDMFVEVPWITVDAPDLLGDYRSPFSTRPDRGIHDAPAPGEKPTVIRAGLGISNSETGGGAAGITPRAVVLACRNGMTRTVDMVRRVHLGARLDEGTIDWSSDTRRKAVDLFTSQIADAARQFVSIEYLTKIVDEQRKAKGVEVQSPTTAVEVMQKRLTFTEAETQSVLDMFVRSGDRTVFGLGQAVTAAAQVAPSAERQVEIEDAAWRIFAEPEAFTGVPA